MEKTTYKFTAFVELFNRSLNRNLKYYAGVDSPAMAFAWINEMSQAGSIDSTLPLVGFGFFVTPGKKEL